MGFPVGCLRRPALPSHVFLPSVRALCCVADAPPCPQPARSCIQDGADWCAGAQAAAPARARCCACHCSASAAAPAAGVAATCRPWPASRRAKAQSHASPFLPTVLTRSGQFAGWTGADWAVLLVLGCVCFLGSGVTAQLAVWFLGAPTVAMLVGLRLVLTIGFSKARCCGAAVGCMARAATNQLVHTALGSLCAGTHCSCGAPAWAQAEPLLPPSPWAAGHPVGNHHRGRPADCGLRGHCCIRHSVHGLPASLCGDSVSAAASAAASLLGPCMPGVSSGSGARPPTCRLHAGGLAVGMLKRHCR